MTGLIMGRNFLDKIIRLMILGLSLYSVGLLYQAVSHDNVIKHQVKCRYCKKRISTKVSGVVLLAGVVADEG